MPIRINWDKAKRRARNLVDFGKNAMDAIRGPEWQAVAAQLAGAFGQEDIANEVIEEVLSRANAAGERLDTVDSTMQSQGYLMNL